MDSTKDFYWRLGEIRGLMDWAIMAEDTVRQEVMQRMAVKLDEVIRDLVDG